MKFHMHLFHGPNTHAPFAAVMAEFANPFKDDLPASAIESQWRLISGNPLWGQATPSASLSLVGLVAALAVRIQHPDDPENANIRIEVGAGKESSWIALGFADPLATALVLETAVELAEKIFMKAAGKLDSLEPYSLRLRQINATLDHALPRAPIVRTLMREARRLGIPVYPVAENSRIWLFGQGAAGFHFFEAASDQDSFTGMHLQRDKTLSNRLVRRLGFPCVSHAVAMNKEGALAIVRQLGYPVVVKPVASGKGKGVSAYVVDDEELGIAFTNAAALSPHGVIVERHVAGTDHRLTVFGSRLVWTAARHPACVTGNGSHSIAELIEAENHRRRHDSAAADTGLLQIEVDSDVMLHLRKQGLSLDSQPSAGATVNLRSVANVSKGGSIADVTSLMHPDNVEMAEAIARGFRMDTLGIDFITPDISRSWREVPCAIIEVNGTPGIFFDSRAEKILLAKFPAGSEGRIPSILLIDAPAETATHVSAALERKGLAVGQTSSNCTILAGHFRCQPGEDLSARVTALISDPACEALVIETSSGWIEKFGLPLDRFDLTLSFQGLPPGLFALVKSCSIHSAESPLPEADLISLIDMTIKRYAEIDRSS